MSINSRFEKQKHQNILEDITNYKSEIGVLYLNDFNRKSHGKIIQGEGLSLHATLHGTEPHVFLSTQIHLQRRRALR